MKLPSYKFSMLAALILISLGSAFAGGLKASVVGNK